MVAVGLLSLFGVMAVAGFGIGGSRPLGIGLLLAAFALLRRLIFGRRRVPWRPGRPAAASNARLGRGAS